jgi:plastocyanin
MTHSVTRKTAVTGLFTLATFSLTLALAGCGGGGVEPDEAITVTEPNVPVASAGGAGAAAAPTGGGTTAGGSGGTIAGGSAATPATTTAPATAAASAGGWGTLKGQVVFNSAPPPVETLEEKGKAKKDPEFCAKDAPIKSQRLMVDSETKGVKYVLVYLSKPTAVSPDAKAAVAKTEVLFDQKGCIFEPHVLGLMAGSEIVLKSSDPVNHNVNARLKVNNAFNDLIAGGATRKLTPTSPERTPCPVTCDIHPWMLGYWMILDHPYFAVTDDKGNFEIKNVPAGTQKVVVWQEATGFVTAPAGEEVAIAAGAPTTKSFTVDAAKVKPAQ